jgi:hypothetical protein
MKTSLRERWQEVAEEIERTKIPEIHLLTVDEDIPKNKAQEMANHNKLIQMFYPLLISVSWYYLMKFYKYKEKSYLHIHHRDYELLLKVLFR